MGAAVSSQVVLFNSNVTRAINQDGFLETVMGDRGIADCGMAQNCVKAWLKEIPLTSSIDALGRQAR